MLPKVHDVISVQEEACAQAFLNQSKVCHSLTASLL